MHMTEGAGSLVLQYALAVHTHTAQVVLHRLACTAFETARYMVAGNPRTSADGLHALLSSTWSGTMWRIAVHPNAADETLLTLLSASTYAVQRRAAKRLRERQVTIPAHLAQLMKILEEAEL